MHVVLINQMDKSILLMTYAKHVFETAHRSFEYSVHIVHFKCKEINIGL